MVGVTQMRAAPTRAHARSRSPALARRTSGSIHPLTCTDTRTGTRTQSLARPRTSHVCSEALTRVASIPAGRAYARRPASLLWVRWGPHMSESVLSLAAVSHLRSVRAPPRSLHGLSRLGARGVPHWGRHQGTSRANDLEPPPRSLGTPAYGRAARYSIGRKL